MPAVAFDPVVEEAVDRLTVELAGALVPSAVRRFVLQARAELCADPPAALPELVERLARARILESIQRPGRLRPCGGGVPDAGTRGVPVG
jgi:hypothetical protein